MQVFDLSNTSLSQACSLNSKRFGGDDTTVAVSRLTNLSQYSSCLPNSLAFDESITHKLTYADDFLCPALRWNSAIPDDGTLNSPDLVIPVGFLNSHVLFHRIAAIIFAHIKGIQSEVQQTLARMS